MAAISYKCPNCGGPLVWDAKKQAYFCDYCNSRFSQADIAKMRPESAEAQRGEAAEPAGQPAEKLKDAAQPDLQKAQAETGGQQTAHYTCPNCGAEIMTDETTAASFCYYCHNPVVLADRLSGDRLPDLVAPFAVSRDQAEEIFLAWMKRHRYIPKDFYDEDQIAHLSGVYFPYWIYACELSGSIEGDGRKLRTWTAGGMQFTETSVYDIGRSASLQVENVARIALKKASRVLCEGVMPFQPEKMRPFSPAYLQGYSAEMRDIEKESLREAVTEEIRTFAEEKLRAEAGNGYSSIEVRKLSADVQKDSWRYALMPVWTLTYQDKRTNKNYYFSINGQTGKTCGELPVDRGRLAALFLSVFVPALLILLLMMYLLL